MTDEFRNDEYAVSVPEATPAKPIPAETGSRTILVNGSASPSCADANDAVARHVIAVINIFFKLLICCSVSNYEYNISVLFLFKSPFDHIFLVRFP